MANRRKQPNSCTAPPLATREATAPDGSWTSTRRNDAQEHNNDEHTTADACRVFGGDPGIDDDLHFVIDHRLRGYGRDRTRRLGIHRASCRAEPERHVPARREADFSCTGLYLRKLSGRRGPGQAWYISVRRPPGS